MDESIKALLELDRDKFKVKNKEYKIKRLSEICGRDIVLTLKPVSFDRLSELKEMHEDFDELKLMIAADGIATDLNPLKPKFKAENKAELIKAMFTPGEIEDIYIAISKMSGYSGVTIEEIKKKSEKTENGN